MQWIVDDSLANFPFWSSAADRAKMLTHSELQELDELLSEHYGGDVPPASEINDLFMFKFDDVCSLLGLNYDKERNVIIRDEANLESVGGAMQAVFESIRKDNPALAETMEAGYKVCMEGVEVGGAYSPDVVAEDEPNYIVILAHDSMDPHPARVAVNAYDESDAIEAAVKNLADHGIEGYAQSEQPEYPDDYVEVANGWVPVELVRVEKCNGIRATHVPEIFLSPIVNGDVTGLSDEERAELDDYCTDLERSGIPSGGLNPVCGPDGEFWDVDNDPRTGKSVLCSVFVVR